MLTVFRTVYAQMIRHAKSSPGLETTGFITGGEGEQTFVPITNIHKEPSKYYAWGTEETRHAFMMMDARGHKPLAFYHSHPNGKPEPSETDMAGAYFQGAHYLIALPASSQQWRATAWLCIEPGILVSDGLTIS